MNNKLFKNPIIISLLASAVVTLIIAGTGVLNRPDTIVSDAWYQSPKALDGEIIVIGIDDKSLNEIGPYSTWTRDVYAEALEKLAEDPESVPAVVAIDCLFIDESDPASDARLAAAAEKLGNVVTASFANIGTNVVYDEATGRTYLDTNAILSYDTPYEALRNVTRQGHINAMLDSDGILRHSLLSYTVDGEKVYSMAYTAALVYGEKNGMTITQPPASSRGHFYVAYSATPGGFNDGYSLVDLLNGEIDPQDYAGKVVFIGPYAVGLQDAYFTSIMHANQMYGVEYQANVVQAILDGNYKKEVTDLPQALLLFAVCFVCFLLFQKKNIKISSIIAVAVIAVYLLAAYLLYEKGIGGIGRILHPLWIPVGVALFYIASIVIHYVKSAIEKQRVTKTFERYVDPEIVKEILKEGTESLSLGGKTCDIAVLFVDVRGFTTMSERLSPEKVVFILNRYLTMASDCVEHLINLSVML